MNKLSLQNLEDNFQDYSFKIEAIICGSCREYKIEIHHKKINMDVIKLEIDQVFNNFAIKVRKGIISDLLEFSNSDINAELMIILRKVINK